MPGFNDPSALAPAASTGDNTHASVRVGGSYFAALVHFVVEATGAGQTVTWKLQGTPDKDSVSDANAHWFDVGYITDASDTIATAAITDATSGAHSSVIFLSNPVARKFNKFRLVTSANTNVTYHADLVLLP